MRVLRDMQHGLADRRSWLIIVPSLLTLQLVLMLIVPELNLAVILFAVIVLVAIIVPFILRLFLYLYARVGKDRFWLKFYVLSRINSPNRNALFVMSGFSLTLLSVLLIAQVKDRLIGDWEASLPGDIPNYFLVNIPTAEVSRLVQFLEDHGIEASSPYALVRARLKQINGVEVKEVEFPTERADRLRNHTFNISYSSVLPADNAVVEGNWIGLREDGDEFSIEAGMAKDMGIQLGDRLAFSVGSETFISEVSSIRSVVWENFRPNFYVLGTAQQLAKMPQTWLMSARLDANKKQWLKPLIGQFPSVTLLDISEVMQRIKGIIDRASIALQFFFGFAILAAFLVLMSALNTANPDRQREIALLVTLGASRRHKLASQAWEFVLMGSLVGIFAAFFASLVANLMAIFFFDLDFLLQPEMWLFSLVSAIFFITFFGLLLIYRGFEVSPMKLLRS
jgi:putative ABC transport system permease protein